MTSTFRSMPTMTLDAGFNKTTSTDHRRRLWVITILSIIYTISVLIARLFGKYGLLWYDDATMGLAYRSSDEGTQCVAIIRWGIQMHAISDGLGANLAIANLLPNGQNIALVRPIKSRKHETDEHLADDITVCFRIASAAHYLPVSRKVIHCGVQPQDLLR
ncbi:hypothetical protein LTR91_022631 [Friedmanniomyces endolithicus]|uniref:Uncharacterized protein n=1 Tax=Friedmanniomyces endolithicus TaxID=329885 RepID=A0AAN6HAF9_9PEZI|nr:hypothetical protein LTS09_017348 [Friedmanniomyces endolithicus]KAK0302481.1 hypothetical protein LTR01_008739 [Friedmanniomyces endolithicus]KAK0894253.1 hypothetical protein LTR57_023605 [Friedmanniomyces endolithicus]KAK0927719.1 hypothetical protein LTR29_017548 [Friedmanniomyces endolithicus]KAK0955910.1 hypothetical protein LTR91_022631 [Friedmanniomyces endolithicus]